MLNGCEIGLAVLLDPTPNLATQPGCNWVNYDGDVFSFNVIRTLQGNLFHG